MAQSFRFPNLVQIDSTDLTDESRSFSEDREERSVVIELASGAKKKYVKGIFKTFQIDWDNVAMSSADTVDGFGGRNEIRALAPEGAVVSLVIQDGRNAEETYSCFVNSYSEEVLQRRGLGDQFRYRVSLALEQQS